MAHEIEQMAYAGETPWHGLGNKVSNDLSPREMAKAAGCNWSVDRVPAFIEHHGRRIPTGVSALVRNTDLKILDTVSDDWEPCQNQEAFDFFSKFVEAGDMEMHTAGSLKGGKIVWAMAKVKRSFTINKKDQIDANLLFTNPHMYGKAIDVRFTPVRVVCNNTLTMALEKKGDLIVRQHHRQKFDPTLALDAIEAASERMNTYKATAEFLSSKRYNDETLMNFYKTVFGEKSGSTETVKSLPRAGQMALDVIGSQPGHEMAAGSWWQAFNSVTYTVDHLIGHNRDTALTSSWFGVNRDKKMLALAKSVEFARAA